MTRTIKIILIFVMALAIHHEINFQPKQRQAFDSIEDPRGSPYLFYGGAKFGGKSYLVRGKEVARRLKYAGTTGVIIRRTFPELLANHIRKIFVEYPWLRKYYKAGEKAIYYPNGSITEFRHLSSAMDVYNYQGIEYDDITLDEGTQHEEEVFKILKTSLRTDPAVKAKNPDFVPKFLITGNPGGIGHAWIKRLFIDKDYTPNETPDDYAFIAAKYKDNPIGVRANPQYVRNLQDLPEDLRRAYLDGDWNIYIGQFFSSFRLGIHTIEPFKIPSTWNKIFALDWGYDPHPYHAGWYTIDFDGNIYKYRELSGLLTSPEDVGRKIVELSKEDEGLYFGVGDTQMWTKNPFSKPKIGVAVTDKSIADQISSILWQSGLSMDQAIKDRENGWTALKSLMEWEGDRSTDGTINLTKTPQYRIFNTCENTIAAYPDQIHSPLRPGDMLKKDGDDPCDTDRYAIMHIYKILPPKPDKNEEELIIEELTTPDPYEGIEDWDEN